jgi:hypothetical protein
MYFFGKWGSDDNLTTQNKDNKQSNYNENGLKGTLTCTKQNLKQIHTHETLTRIENLCTNSKLE